MNTTTNDAHEAYRAARENLDQRLNAINRLVREHAEQQFKNRRNWGFVGDVNHVVELLDEVIEFLGGAKETT